MFVLSSVQVFREDLRRLRYLKEELDKRGVKPRNPWNCQIVRRDVILIGLDLLEKEFGIVPYEETREFLDCKYEEYLQSEKELIEVYHIRPATLSKHERLLREYLERKV